MTRKELTNKLYFFATAGGYAEMAPGQLESLYEDWIQSARKEFIPLLVDLLRDPPQLAFNSEKDRPVWDLMVAEFLHACGKADLDELLAIIGPLLFEKSPRITVLMALQVAATPKGIEWIERLLKTTELSLPELNIAAGVLCDLNTEEGLKVLKMLRDLIPFDAPLLKKKVDQWLTFLASVDKKPIEGHKGWPRERVIFG